jgi:hypothetical protein
MEPYVVAGLPEVSFGFIGMSNGLFYNNSFLRNRNAGLAIVGTNVTIIYNNLSNNVGFGLVSLVENGFNNISNNYINHNNMSGILISGANNLVENNEIIGNGDGTTTLDDITFESLNFIFDFLGIGDFSSSSATNVFWWNGIVSVWPGDSNVDIYRNNRILDNYNYGIFFYLNSSSADLYNNIICNNSLRSGINRGQVVIGSSSITVNADTSDPYNNSYCDSDPYWIQNVRTLVLDVSPPNANVAVVGYVSNISQFPIQAESGKFVYVLSLDTYYNGTETIDTPYQWTVSKPGYATKTGLAMMTDEDETVNVILKYASKIVCPSNSTLEICQIMSESGAGLGSFIEYLGSPLLMLLVILVITGVVAAVGFSVAMVFRGE